MKRLTESLHLLHDNENYLAYHKPSYSIIGLSPEAYQVLSLASIGNTEEKIASYTGFSIDNIHDLFQALEQKIGRLIPEFNTNLSDENNKEIYRITLHIANDCNLRCKYCYAAGGNYNLKRELMSNATADAFISFCINNFCSIENIVFFGGEPLLNYKIIDYICNQFKELYSKSKIKKLPNFGLITNGTLMNRKILGVLKRHISFITISLDGPQDVNDANRIFSNGEGSYNKIISFIKTIKEYTDIRLKYEATYTIAHLEKNISYADMNSFFKSLGLDGVITKDINIEKSLAFPNKKMNILQNTDFSSISLPEGFWSVFSAIVNRRPKQLCQVYRRIFAVSTTGEIYACHMDNGDDVTRLGDIFSHNIFSNPEEYFVRHPLLANLTNKDILCGDCWAKNICAGCTRKWFFNKIEHRYLMTPHKDLCLSNKKHLDKIILLIAKLRKNNLLWNDMLRTMSLKK